MTPNEIVRTMRRSAGLTQTELGERLGMTQTAIAKLERPGANPTYNTLERVLAAAGYKLQFIPAAWSDTSSVDVSMISESLSRRTPGERIESIQPLYDSAKAMRRAVVAAQADG